MSRPINVLVWSPRGAGSGYSGAGMAAGKLYAADAGVRFKAELAHGNPLQGAGPPFHACHCIHPLDGNRWWPHMRFLGRARTWLRGNAGRFEVMHGITAFHMTAAPAHWAEAMGLPSVVKITSHNLDLRPQHGVRALLGTASRRRRWAAGWSAVIAISEAIAEELLACGVAPERIARIPNAVDVERFRPLPAAERSALRTRLGLPSAPIVACCGVLGARKRPGLLLDALAGLPGWHAVLVGPFADPGSEASLRAQAASLGGRVTFTGMVADPAPYLAAADAYCLPSVQEGQPNSVLEALASGLPCVLTAFAGAHELVDARTGLVVADAPGAIAEGLRDLLGRLDTAAPAARAAAVEKYRPERVLELHRALFATVAAKGRP